MSTNASAKPVCETVMKVECVSEDESILTLTSELSALCDTYWIFTSVTVGHSDD